MKESDLFNPIKKFLLNSGYSEIYAEVLDCDVIAFNNKCTIAIELKTTLSFKLIDQAVDRLNIAHYVYIAVPKRKTHLPRCVKKILSQYGIGLIEIGDGFTYIKIPAKYNRLVTKRRNFNMRDYIKDFHAEQIGGVKSGEGETQYSRMIDNIKEFMKYYARGNWVTVDDILDHCETYYANPKPSVMATLQAKWNRNWCETKTEGRKKYFRIKEGV